jgi:hypothetical protein
MSTEVDTEGKYVDNLYLKLPKCDSADIYSMYSVVILEDFLYIIEKKKMRLLRL